MDEVKSGSGDQFLFGSCQGDVFSHRLESPIPKVSHQSLPPSSLPRRRPGCAYPEHREASRESEEVACGVRDRANPELKHSHTQSN
eukprot:752605-Hanusia_phi.AAC.1